jgi:predicted NAD/FAD-dependent oxidoreductase
MHAILAASLCLFLSANLAAAGQHAAAPIHVAIVGAGVGGASAAFHLHEMAADNSDPLSVTIFEVGPAVGGRIKSAYPPEYAGNPDFAFEAGAPWIFETDSCMRAAADRTASTLHRAFHGAAVWSHGVFVESAVCHNEDPRRVVDDARRFASSVTWRHLFKWAFLFEANLAGGIHWLTLHQII